MRRPSRRRCDPVRRRATNQNGTDSWSLFPSRARYIHIDVDSREIGRNYEALRLVGDDA